MSNTFTFVPDQAIQHNKEYSIIVSEFENGSEQRRQKRDNPKNEWTLSFKVRSKSERDSFVVFFDGQKGSLIPFSWTNPEDNISRLVRFKENTLSVEKIHYDLYNFSVQLLEVNV